MKKSVQLSLLLLVLPGLAAASGIHINFAAPTGPMKPLHGVNNAPILHFGKQTTFQDAGIPFMRTHDTCGTYGGAHYVDIPNVFPNFDADENEPASYDFALTDAFLSTAVAAGTEPFYRLGVTIEGVRRLIKPYHILPPKDFAKWARICEHVIRHYTEGWANGKTWRIRYWEIWNEPDNPDMWQGSMETFFELYRTTSLHLKKCFPSLKIGGYASCGFYELDRSIDPRYANGSYLHWFKSFIDYVQAPETKCPLDFFSWHVYTDDANEVARHARFCRNWLNSHGLEKTESILDEWNFINHAKYGDAEFDLMKEAPGAAFVAAVFCKLQRDKTVDIGMYYDALPSRRYCGLYYFPSYKTTPTYASFVKFNALYRLGTAVQAKSDLPTVEVCAATDGKTCKALLVNIGETHVTVDVTRKSLSGKETRVQVELPAKDVRLLD